MTRFPVILLGLALLVAGCGNGSSAPPVANVGATPTTSLHQSGLQYSECMRSHGVPNFPDPSPGGGFEFMPSSGVSPSSPAVRRAQAACRKYVPGGGAIAPGAQTHPTSAWLTHTASVARCMRRHGVTDFPDPRTSIPSPLPVNGVVSDIQGAVLVFKNGSEEQSPVFVRAAAACGFPLHNH